MSRNSTPDNRRVQALPGWKSRIGWAGLGLLILLYLMVRDGGAPEENLQTVRYLLFAWVALLAWILPYISFPDPEIALWQLLNRPSSWFHTHLLSRHRYLIGGASLLLLATAMDGESGWNVGWPTLRTVIYSLLFAFGIWFMAATDLIRIGARSQFWQESERGREIALRVAAIAKYPIDSGSIPSLLSTIRLTLIGMGGVVAGAWMSLTMGPAGELAVAMGVFAIGAFRYGRVRGEAAPTYYRTHAFFSEFFTPPKERNDGERELEPDQLWWVPGHLRIHAWGLLVQLDRTLPAGRVLLVGHLLIWLLAYSGADGGQLWVFWSGFALLHQAWQLPTGTEGLVPGWLRRSLATPWQWTQIRFWMQIRWLLPLLASAGVMQWLFARYPVRALVWMAIFYLGASLLTAIGVTWWSHRPTQFESKRTAENA